MKSQAQNEKDAIKTVDIKGIKELILNSLGNVSMIQSEENLIRVYGDEKILGSVTFIKAGSAVMKITGAAEDSLHSQGRIKIVIYTADIEKLSATAIGILNVKDGCINKDNAAVNFSSIGILNIEISNETSNIRVRGIGSLNIGGTSEKGDIYISGVGNLNDSELGAGNTKMHIHLQDN